MTDFTNANYEDGWLRAEIRAIFTDLVYVEQQAASLFKDDLVVDRAALSVWKDRHKQCLRRVHLAIQMINDAEAAVRRKLELDQLSALEKQVRRERIAATLDPDIPLPEFLKPKDSPGNELMQRVHENSSYQRGLPDSEQ